MKPQNAQQTANPDWRTDIFLIFRSSEIMSEKKRRKLHDIFESILDEHLGFMSGKIIKKGESEQRKYFQIDYRCTTVGELSKDYQKKPIELPFDHLKQENIIEFKSFHEVLNEKTFRNYIGRALITETEGRTDLQTESRVNLQGKVTLTIITTRKPEALIACGNYAIEQISDWKYKSRCFKDLDVFILVIRRMDKEG